MKTVEPSWDYAEAAEEHPGPAAGAGDPARASQGRQALSRAVHEALPGQLAAGVEQLSGLSMADVRVHYDSPRPRELGAAAFAQGAEIHLGPGQERHLPHEAWHVVQQLQGRVAPTNEAAGVELNDDGGLEQEADAMGAQALEAGAAGPAVAPSRAQGAAHAPVQRQVVQRQVVQLENEPAQTTQAPSLRDQINTALRHRTLAERRDGVVAALDAASAADVRQVVGDAAFMRRINEHIGWNHMPAVRGAMARRLHAEGAHEEAFRRLVSQHRNVQTRNLEAFGPTAQQRALEEGVIQTSQDDALVRTAFSAYWGLSLTTQGARLDRDGDGPRGRDRTTAQWTATRLREIHAQLRALPEQDVRVNTLENLHLLTGQGGGYYAEGQRRFGLGANSSNHGRVVHHLTVAAARQARSVTLDSVEALDAGIGFSLTQGSVTESGVIERVDRTTNTVHLQHALLNDYPVGATFRLEVSPSSYRFRGTYLAQDVAAGVSDLRLNALTGLEQGDALVIDESDARLMEVRTLASIDTATNTIRIDRPLVRPHPHGCVVRRSNGTEANHSLTVAAAAADTTLTLASAQGIPAGAQMLIDQGAASEERVTIQSADTATGVVRLQAPLTQAHAIGAAVVRVPATAAAAGYTVATQTAADSETVTLNTVDGLGARDRLILDRGTASEEECVVRSVDAAQNRLTLTQRLFFRHAPGVAVTLVPARELLQISVAAAAGATTITLNSLTNLHVGDALTLSIDTASEEQVRIQGIEVATRIITLQAPLTKSHEARAIVLRLQSTPGHRPDEVPDMNATVRHEIAHALDARLGNATLPFKRDIGGWRETTNFDEWANAMGTPWQTRSGAAISAADQRLIRDHILSRMRSAGGQELNHGLAASHPIQRYWSEDVPVIEAAKMTRHGDRFWQTPSSVRIYNNRAFSINHHYRHLQYSGADVHQHRIADYSSFSAAEFFAEVYTVFYEEAHLVPAPEPGRLVPIAAWRDWMRDHIHNRGQTPQAAATTGPTTPSVGMAANNPGPT